MTKYYFDLEPIKPRELSEEEKEWLNTMTSISYGGVEILKLQIMKSKVVSACKCGCKSIGLKIDEACPKFESKVTVPIQMFATYTDGVPIIFFLHLKDGYIEELEVLKADSTPITEPIDMSTVTFEIQDY